MSRYKLTNLREMLKKSIDEQDFERAAELQRQINEIEHPKDGTTHPDPWLSIFRAEQKP